MLEGMKPPVRVRTCAVRTLMENLEEKDVIILTAAIGDLTNWPAKTLSKALQQRDILLGDNSITAHRRGLCSC